MRKPKTRQMKGRKDKKILVRNLLAAEDSNGKHARTKEDRQRYKHHHDWEIDGVLVSDHAVLRYLQHTKGLDVKTIREQLCSNGRSKVIRDLRTCKIPMSEDGVRLVARGGMIITVLKSTSGTDNDA